MGAAPQLKAARPGVVFFAASGLNGLSGTGRVRSYWPAEALSARGSNVRTVYPAAPLGLKADVVVIHRPRAQHLAALVRAYRGARVLLQVDDDTSCIPASNTLQSTLEQEEMHQQAIREADGLIVATERLGQVYGPLARRWWRVPNYLPEWAGDRHARPGRSVKVGWAGTTDTHRQDLAWIAPEIHRLLESATLTTVGDRRTPDVLGVQGEAEGNQRDYRRYLGLMARADIGIVPLDTGADREFNEAKSWLKALEYVTLGIPVVATDLPEQRRLLEGSGAGFLVETPAEMADRVQQLVHDHGLRAEMAAAAAALGRTMALDRHVEEWERVLEEAV